MCQLKQKISYKDYYFRIILESIESAITFESGIAVFSEKGGDAIYYISSILFNDRGRLLIFISKKQGVLKNKEKIGDIKKRE
ncbi:hypothetical protein [Siminovitchia sediminis]|uniref:hypothetical protein n=1 Tax=Siminovitchia sediminis TaxID=1274353 RepID=UPI0036D2F6CE